MQRPKSKNIIKGLYNAYAKQLNESVQRRGRTVLQSYQVRFVESVIKIKSQLGRKLIIFIG